MASLKYVANSSLQTVTLGSGYTSGSGSMTLTSGHGARLPTGGDFWLAYNDGAGTVRLFKVTARSTDTLTVVADATEGSGDGNITSGETLRWALTVAALDQLKLDIVASGALVLLESETASNSSELTFTTCISSDYDQYQIMLSNIVPASATSIRLQVSTDGGSSYDSNTANYGFGGVRSNSGGQVVQGSNSEGSIGLSSTQGNGSTDAGLSGTVIFTDPNSTTRRKSFTIVTTEMSSGAYSINTMGGAYNSTTAVNAFRIFANTGNITSGTVRVYGLKK